MTMLFVIKQEVPPTKGMAPPTFHTFRARNANLYLCGRGMLWCRASFKLNMLQNLMKPKYIDKNMKNNFLTFNRIFQAKMKHILSVTVVENMQVVCQLFTL